jgi:hypothetical protein
MPISANGGPFTANGNALLTLSVTPVTAGDLLVFSFQASTVTALSTSVSGGGVATWFRASGYLDTGTGSGALNEIWYGVITSTGTFTITLANATVTGFCRLHAREWTGLPSWALLAGSPSPATSGGAPTGTGLAVSYPALTGSGLYIGAGDSIFGNMSGGSTSGFTYDNNNGHQEVAWDTAAVSAAPTSVQTNTGAYEAVAALFGAASSPGVSGSIQPLATVRAPRRPPPRAVVRFTPAATVNAAPVPGPAGTVPALMVNQTRRVTRRDGRVIRR